MCGHEWLEGFAVGVVIVSIGCLSWSLFGLELAIIFTATTVLGIALSLTQSHGPEQDDSPTLLLHSPHLRSRRRSVLIKRDVFVTPDSPELYKQPKRRHSRHLAAVQRSLSSEQDFLSSKTTRAQQDRENCAPGQGSTLSTSTHWSPCEKSKSSKRKTKTLSF
jgi:hypothetical protein